jgi:imidazole glycerol-phosphate synthase subunit HisF
MLKKRLINSIVFYENQVVRGEMFNNWRRIDTVLPIVRVYNLREVDEIALFDIGASRNEYQINYKYIESLVKESTVPVSYGGGINSADQIRKLLELGVEKVVLNSVLYSDITILKECVLRFGAQAITVAIDVMKVDSEYYCFSNSGTNNTKILLNDWLQYLQQSDYGEILITSINKDGTRTGYDIELYSHIDTIYSKNTPLIASGGAWSVDDFINIFQLECVSAAAASSTFLFSQTTPKVIKRILNLAGVQVRN